MRRALMRKKVLDTAEKNFWTRPLILDTALLDFGHVFFWTRDFWTFLDIHRISKRHVQKTIFWTRLKILLEIHRHVQNPKQAFSRASW